MRANNELLVIQIETSQVPQLISRQARCVDLYINQLANTLVCVSENLVRW